MPEQVPQDPAQQNYQTIEQGQQQSSSQQSRRGNIVQGVQAAHADYVAWFYKPHGSLFDNQLAQMDQNGMKRELIGYAMIGLTVVLLCTKMAPLVANLVCIAYPILGTLSLLHGGSQDVQRWSVYWVVFGLLSLTDYYCGISTLYWMVKILICVFLYLPQTQGACLVYALAIEPSISFIEARLI